MLYLQLPSEIWVSVKLAASGGACPGPSGGTNEVLLEDSIM